MSHLRNKRESQRKQRGQSIAEVMISLPFIMGIVIAVVEMGIVFASYIALVNGAREGAVFASKCTFLQDSSKDSDSSCVCSGSCTNDNIDEYVKRVRNDVFPVGSPLIENQLQFAYPDCIGDIANPLDYRQCLQVERPVFGPTTSSCPTGGETNCPITVTVHYRVHTLTSGMQLPYFGRFGLPNYYLLNYSYGTPIRGVK